VARNAPPAMTGRERADSPPLLHSVRQLGATALGMLHTRMSLAGVELEEELQRLLGIIAMTLAALLFVALALLVFTFMIIYVVAEDDRVMAMAILGVLYVGAAVLFGWRVKTVLAERPPLFAETLAELEKDRVALQPSQLETVAPVHEASGGEA
jgi:uncharacterized membrane protein YqjE